MTDIHKNQKKYLGITDLINLQYRGKLPQKFKDIEITCLKCTEFYQVPPTYNEPTVPIFACKFSPFPAFKDIVAAADENGYVSLHKIDNLSSARSLLQTHDNAVFDITWVPNHPQLLTLSGDHTSKLWDCGEAEMRLVSSFDGHSKSVKTADFKPTDPATFVTGSRDGTVMLWDARCHKTDKPDQVIVRAATDANKKGNPHIAMTSVTAVLFQDANNLLVAGSSDPYIRVWDMRKTYCSGKISETKRKIQAPKSGFSDLKISTSGSRLYASCMGDAIYCFNLNSDSDKPVAKFERNAPCSFYVKICVSSDGEYLISGSTDKQVIIWNTRYAEKKKIGQQPLITLEGHVAEVTGVDFSDMDLMTLVSCADDGTLRKWRPTFEHSKNTNALDHVLESLYIAEEDFQPRSTRGRSDVLSNNRQGYNSNTTDNETPSKEERVQYTPRSYNLTNHKRKRINRTPSPSKTPEQKRLVLSPRKMNTPDPEYQSPTANLPNYVIDGFGPSHRCTKQKENVDWLTQMRRTQRLSSAEKSVEKVEGSSGKKRNLFRGGSEKKSRKTLLEYYKKSGKSNDESQKVP